MDHISYRIHFPDLWRLSPWTYIYRSMSFTVSLFRTNDVFHHGPIYTGLCLSPFPCSWPVTSFTVDLYTQVHVFHRVLVPDPRNAYITRRTQALYPWSCAWKVSANIALAVCECTLAPLVCNWVIHVCIIVWVGKHIAKPVSLMTNWPWCQTGSHSGGSRRSLKTCLAW